MNRAWLLTLPLALTLACTCSRRGIHSVEGLWIMQPEATPYVAHHESNETASLELEHSRDMQTQVTQVRATVELERRWLAVLTLSHAGAPPIAIWHLSPDDPLPRIDHEGRCEWTVFAALDLPPSSAPTRLELIAYLSNDAAPRLPARDLDADALTAALEQLAALPDSQVQRVSQSFVVGP